MFPGIISQINYSHPNLYLCWLVGNPAKTSNVPKWPRGWVMRPEPEPGLPGREGCTTPRERVPSVSPAVPSTAWGQAGQPSPANNHSSLPYSKPLSVILATRPGLAPRAPGVDVSSIPSRREDRAPAEVPILGSQRAAPGLSQPQAGPSSLK